MMNLNFFPSLWRTSKLEQLLENTTTFTLELMDQDDFLEETRFLNERLIKLLAKPESIKILLTQILEGPLQEGANPQRYPAVSSEVFNFGIGPITSLFFEQTELLDTYFAFLDRPSPLPLVNSIYFCKMGIMFLEHQKIAFFEYMKSKPGLVEKFIDHISSPAICDFLLAMIRLDQMEVVGFIQWLQESKMVDHMLAKLDKQENYNTINQFLVDIVTVSSSPSPLVDQLDKQENIEKLLSQILTNDAANTKRTSSLSSDGLDVVTSLLQWHTYNAGMLDDQMEIDQQSRMNGADTENGEVLKSRRTSLEDKAVIKVVYDHLAELHKQLATEQSKIEGLVDIGRPAFGSYRLKLLQFFVSLLATALYNPSVYTKLLEVNFLETCLDLFFRFDWNNFVHHQIEEVIRMVIESDSEPLKANMFEQCHITTRIRESFSAGIPKGYFGHLTRISNTLISYISLYKWMENDIEWKTFVETKLDLVNKIESTPLGQMNLRELIPDYLETYGPDDGQSGTDLFADNNAIDLGDIEHHDHGQHQDQDTNVVDNDDRGNDDYVNNGND